MAKIVPIKTIIERSKEPGYFPNYYDILGIPRFGNYDKSRKLTRMDENRREVLDKEDQTSMSKLILEADKILKNQSSKEQYDQQLKKYLDKVTKSSGSVISYGMPSLGVHSEAIIDDVLFFEELKPNSKFTKLLTVKNTAHTGILDATIATPKEATWLNISPTKVTQNELHIPVKVIVDTNENLFGNSSSKSSFIRFTYQTDRGTRRFDQKVYVSLEGLAKKIERLSKVSIMSFSAFYALVILYISYIGGFQTSSLIYSLLLFGSIGYLAYTMNNLSKADGFRDFFKRNKYSLPAILPLFGIMIFNFEVFFLFFMSVLSILIIRVAVSKKLFTEYIKFLPLAAILLYCILVFSSKDLRRNFAPSTYNELLSLQQGASNANYGGQQVEELKNYVTLKTDCNIRVRPSANANIISVAKAGSKVDLIEYSPKSQWQRVMNQGTEGYMYVTDETATLHFNSPE